MWNAENMGKQADTGVRPKGNKILSEKHPHLKCQREFREVFDVVWVHGLEWLHAYFQDGVGERLRVERGVTSFSTDSYSHTEFHWSAE